MNKTRTFLKKTRIKNLAVGLAVLFLLFAGAGLFIAIKWKPLLRETIENTVMNVSDSLYRIKFSDVELNLFTGSVYFENIEIKADSSSYLRMIGKGTAPENIFSLHIRKLNIRNIKPFKVYFQRKLDIRDIKILEPELTVTYTRLKNKPPEGIDRRTTYEKIKNTLNAFNLDHLSLLEIAFTYIDKSLKKPEITKIKRVSINVNDILIDSISQFDSSRVFHSKDIGVQLNGFEYATSDSLYRIKIGKLNVSTLHKNLIVKEFQLIPRYGEMAFSNLFKRQNERYSIIFDSIKLDQINFPKLIDNRTIEARKLTLNNGELAVFLNRAKPRKLIDKARNYPHVALKRVNWTINTDTVSIRRTNIRYSEYMSNTDAKGTVSFYNLRGNIFRVTNDSSLLQQQKYINAYLQASFLGQADLNVHIRFNMTDAHSPFTYNGTLKNLELHSLNPLSRPLAKVAFSSGKIHELSFNVSANTNGGGGTVKILYDDLKVNLLKKASENENFKRMGLLSFLANALIIKDANPIKNEGVRIAKPYYERPPDASFFNVMWKVIFLGFKETIGITQKKEAEIKATTDRFKENQKRREERKLRRKQRKEEQQHDK